MYVVACRQSAKAHRGFSQTLEIFTSDQLAANRHIINQFKETTSNLQVLQSRQDQAEGPSRALQRSQIDGLEAMKQLVSSFEDKRARKV